MSITPPKKSVVMRQSYQSTVVNNYSTAAKTSAISPERRTQYSQVKEIPLDPHARYTISQVPGMSEHEIDTGRSLEEARMKVVLLTCELERVNTYNYTLVRENEVLRVQANKSERERDLETKLAIVLAENEKLNQIIEEVYDVYMSQRGQASASSSEEYEKRIYELYSDLEEWKQKYNVLETQNVVELQNTIHELRSQNELISEELSRKDRDLEAIRARLASLEKSSNQDSALQGRLAEYDNKIRLILAENEKLNEMLMGKVKEIKNLNNQIEDNESNYNREIEALRRQMGEKAKKAGAGQADLSSRLQELAGENDHLRNQVEVFKSQLNGARDSEGQVAVLIEENQRLTIILHEKERELIALQEVVGQSRDAKANLERLTIKIQELIRENDELRVRFGDLQQSSVMSKEYKDKIILITSENERLNTLLQNKFEEVETLKRRIATLESTKVDASSYEEKIRILISENQRLSDLVRANNQEIDTLRIRVREAQSQGGQVNELTAKITLVASENERLNGELNTLRVRIHEITTERYRFETLIAEKERELEGMRHSHARSLENSTIELNRQNETLKSAGADQRRKITDLEARLAQFLTLESRVAYLNSESERLTRELAEKDSQIQYLSIRLGESEGLDAKIRLLISEKKELEDKAKYAESEVYRLNISIKEIRGEVDSWKSRYIQLEHSREESNREVEELRIQFEGFKTIGVQIKEMQQKFSAERLAYEAQLLQLNQSIFSLEHENRMLLAENERVTTLSIQRLNQLEEFRSSNSEESHKLEIYELRNQLEQLKSNSYDIKQLAVQYNSERAADQAKIAELNSLNLSYRGEIEKLKDLLEKRRLDYEALTQQNEEVRMICEKLNHQHRASTSSSSLRAETVEIMQVKIAELEGSRNEYQRQAEKNAIDLSRKNRELVDKIQELDVLKLKYEEALANYQALNTQIFARLSVK